MVNFIHCFKKVLILVVLIATFACKQSETETGSLYNQLALNEERNAEVVLKLTNAVEQRGNRTEELAFLKTITDLVNLKKRLNLNTNKLKNSISYNLQNTIIYADTLTARFETVDNNEQFIDLLFQAKSSLAGLEPENEDEYLHAMLQISYCETNLYSL